MIGKFPKIRHFPLCFLHPLFSEAEFHYLLSLLVLHGLLGQCLVHSSSMCFTTPLPTHPPVPVHFRPNRYSAAHKDSPESCLFGQYISISFSMHRDNGRQFDVLIRSKVLSPICRHADGDRFDVDAGVLNLRAI